MDNLELTESSLRRSFDDRSFKRGERYFRQGRVVSAVRFSDKIWGMVDGTRAEPYRVTVEPYLDGVVSWCSCPVGSRCKHGVALAIRWLEEPGSFVDGEAVIRDLGGRPREELFDLLETMLRSDPSLLPTFERAMIMSDARRGDVDLVALKGEIGRSMAQGLDYYRIDGVVDELRDVLHVACILVDESMYEAATETCMLVVEACLDAYERGADDSSGTMGELVGDSVALFSDSMRGIDSGASRDGLLFRVLDLYGRDQYGLGLDGLVFGSVTNENIEGIEKELVRRTEGERDGRRVDGSWSHRQQAVTELVSDLRKHVEDGG